MAKVTRMAPPGDDVPLKLETMASYMEHTPSKIPVQRVMSVAKFGNESFFARVAYNPYFENTTMGVIVLNAMWLGIDTEWNHDNLKENGKLPLEPYSIVVENLFCLYFSMELAVRFLAYRQKRMCFFDAWFVFDSVLVSCMVLETWIMVIVEAIMASDSGGGISAFSALRLLRLLRLARMGRLMRFVPEMLKLVKGMVAAARSVFFILIFLILVIYITSIIFTGALADRDDFPLTPDCTSEMNESLHDDASVLEGCVTDGAFGGWEDFNGEEVGVTAPDLFATMGDSFMTLLTRGVLGDNLAETFDVIVTLKSTSGSVTVAYILTWVFVIFMIVTFATLLNMLIGVVCDVISDAAQNEQDIQTVNMLSDTIQDAFAEIDCNEDGLVCVEEWEFLKENSHVRKTLVNVGIEEERMEERLAQMQEMLFKDCPDSGTDGTSMTSASLSKSPSQIADLTRNESSKSNRAAGLTVKQLIQRVVEIRPDQNASALDMELLKAQVTKDQKVFQRKLKRIEEGVKKTLGPGANIEDEKDGAPHMPTMPNDIMEDLKKKAEGNRVNLEDVPTDLLVEAMRARADEAMLEPPLMLGR